MTLHFLLAVFVGLSRAASALTGHPAAQELNRLEGTWDVVRTEEGGKPTENDGPRRVVIEGGVVIWRDSRGRGVAGLLRIDPSQGPRAIDMVIGLGPCICDVKIPGIYALRGNELKLCFGDRTRPTDFTTRPGSPARLVVLQRVKP